MMIAPNSLVHQKEGAQRKKEEEARGQRKGGPTGGGKFDARRRKINFANFAYFAFMQTHAAVFTEKLLSQSWCEVHRLFWKKLLLLLPFNLKKKLKDVNRTDLPPKDMYYLCHLHLHTSIAHRIKNHLRRTSEHNTLHDLKH